MPLKPGDKLGPYEILAPIGKGGMGEVWKAHDPRLRRYVAIKTSAEHFSERFEREAHAIAALNHPNICQIYDVGPNYLVMEYIEGTPLKGPLPVDQALKYAAQICDALDAAHKKGITHRDLKPANILVTKAGIKLLDFGLAKIEKPVAVAQETVTMALTSQGQILGTLLYMSPEQLQGKEADARSDIFSFGCVLYEMLTGKRAFDGASPASVIAAILERPAPSAGDLAPPALDRVLKRCFEKDPENRWQSARDLRSSLEVATAGSAIIGKPPRQAPGHNRLSWFAAAAMATFAVLALWAPWKPADTPPQVLRLQVAPPGDAGFANATLSPDGRTLAFIGIGADNLLRLWVRPLDSPDARILPSTDVSMNTPPFFWSDDGRFLVYTAADGRLKKVDLSGGAPQALCDIPGRIAVGGSWNRDGVILFGTTVAGIFRVSSNGGVATPVTQVDAVRKESRHAFPAFLPDGKHFIYQRTSTVPENSGVFLGSLAAKPEEQEQRQLIGTPFGPGYVPGRGSEPGWILSVRDSTLWAESFNEKTLQNSGDPQVVARGVATSIGAGQFSASRTNVLIYGSNGGVETRAMWIDRSGHLLPLQPQTGAIQRAAAIAPDGQRVVEVRQHAVGPGRDLWLTDSAPGTATRLTFDPRRSESPVFTSDGRRIIFASSRDGAFNIYQKPMDGIGNEEALLKSTEDKMPTSVSGDSKWLLYSVTSAKTKSDVFALSLDTRKSTPFLQAEADESEARFSPAGKWVAYTSDESGRNEIYVREFPGTAGKWLVSNGGGTNPRWRGDGKELYYAAADGSVMVVEIASSPVFQSGTPAALFKVPPSGSLSNWDVTPDGKRFYVLTVSGYVSKDPMTVVVNWQVGLKK